MAFENGRRYICDRCGAETFCRCIGEGEMDGGFTRWNKFEALPGGWKSHLSVGLLCPECNHKYTEMLTELMGRSVE